MYPLLRRLSAVLACALLALALLGACGAAQVEPAATDPAVDAETEQQRLRQTLTELDRLALPYEMDLTTFAALKAALRRTLLARTTALVPAPPGEASRVTDLQLDTTSGSPVLTWSYRNSGDYDRNGEVNLGDITPLGRHFGERYSDSTWEGARADGDGNGEVNLADVTPIGAGLQAAVDGYVVYGRAAAGDYEEIGRISTADKDLNEPLRYVLSGVDYEFYAVAPLLNGEQGAQSFPAYREPGMLRFAGRDWIVRQTAGPEGPGPNLFTALPGQVCVEQDEQGEVLRLNAALGEQGYHCAEIYTPEPLGYGTYVFFLETPLSQINRELVLGLFTYDYSDAGFQTNANSEIDIEIGQFGGDDDEYLQFAVQPSFGVDGPADVLFPERARRMPVAGLDDGPTTLAFQWTSTEVRFAGYSGHRAPTAIEQVTWLFPPGARTWTFTADNPPRVKTEDGRQSDPVVIPTPGEAGTHINLWWFRQDSETGMVPPPQEVLLRGFEFFEL